MYSAKVLADSLSPEGVRLTTFEVRFPRFILAEFNTHRMLSRNSASSRAIPTEKLIADVVNDPFVPEFNARVKGMGVGDKLDDIQAAQARAAWMQARDNAVNSATKLLYIDKSRVNRLLEPFMWHTALATATEWGNFFALRTHPTAQPEFRTLALMMQEAYAAHEAWPCPWSCWHIPLVDLDELGPNPDYDHWVKVATGRCARVSYLTHDGKRDAVQDIGLHNRLLESRHLSPFEHVARPFSSEEWMLVREEQEELRHLHRDRAPQQVEAMCRALEYRGNLRGWRSYRIDIPDEHDFSLTR